MKGQKVDEETDSSRPFEEKGEFHLLQMKTPQVKKGLFTSSKSTQRACHKSTCHRFVILSSRPVGDLLSSTVVGPVVGMDILDRPLCRRKVKKDNSIERRTTDVVISGTLFSDPK